MMMIRGRGWRGPELVDARVGVPRALIVHGGEIGMLLSQRAFSEDGP